jgi:hypothetical protein
LVRHEENVDNIIISELNQPRSQDGELIAELIKKRRKYLVMLLLICKKKKKFVALVDKIDNHGKKSIAFAHLYRRLSLKVS